MNLNLTRLSAFNSFLFEGNYLQIPNRRWREFLIVLNRYSKDTIENIRETISNFRDFLLSSLTSPLPYCCNKKINKKCEIYSSNALYSHHQFHIFYILSEETEFWEFFNAFKTLCNDGKIFGNILTKFCPFSEKLAKCSNEVTQNFGQ